MVGCSEVKADPSGSYLFKSATEIDFLTITVTGQKLSGYIQSITLVKGPPISSQVKNASFVGELSGSNFTIHSETIDKIFGNSINTCSGILGPNKLSLYLPQPNGMISTNAYLRKSPAVWNKEVASYGTLVSLAGQLEKQILSRHEVRKALGKLGQAKAALKIFASEDATSHLYYVAKPFAYLVIEEGSSKDWKTILMQNGQLGYAESDLVAELPYQVTNSSLVGDELDRASGEKAAVFAVEKILENCGSSEEVTVKTADSKEDFIHQCYLAAGRSISSSVQEQRKLGKAVKRFEDLAAGDRLYFEGAGSDLLRDGIYLGNGYFGFRPEGGLAQLQLMDESLQKRLHEARRGGTDELKPSAVPKAS